MDTQKLNAMVYDFEAVKSRIVMRYIQLGDRRIIEDDSLLDRMVVVLPGTAIGMVWDIDLTDVFPEAKVTVAVTPHLREQWKVTVQDIITLGKQNTLNLRPTVVDSLEHMLFGSNPEDEGGFPMIVVTNEEKYYGAVAISYTGVKEKIRSIFREDFYVLPSSVHECICVPKSRTDKNNLLEMVQSINASNIVGAADFLADDVLEFRNDILCSALEKEQF